MKYGLVKCRSALPNMWKEGGDNDKSFYKQEFLQLKNHLYMPFISPYQENQSYLRYYTIRRRSTFCIPHGSRINRRE